jgi:hypothetical protein|tara:strand:+ start:6838 stop:7008 length:171 start_codon:yes stop_codon:yes gene_type:complete
MTGNRSINFHYKKLLEYLENNIEPTHFGEDIVWMEGHDPGDEDVSAWKGHKQEKEK